MTEYATKDVTTRARYAGSLYRPQYTMSAASEEPAENPIHLTSMPGVARYAALTYRIAPILDFSGGQGTITAANYSTEVSSTAVTTATCFAQLNSTEYLDPRNIAASNLSLSLRNILWSKDSSIASGNVSSHSQVRSVLLTDEVLAFCSQQQIFNHFQHALRLAQQSFLDLRDINVKVENDPESDGEWLLIVVQIHGEIEKVLEMYDTYAKGLVRAVPWPARDKIRLIYDFV